MCKRKTVSHFAVRHEIGDQSVHPAVVLCRTPTCWSQLTPHSRRPVSSTLHRPPFGQQSTPECVSHSRSQLRQDPPLSPCASKRPTARHLGRSSGDDDRLHRRSLRWLRHCRSVEGILHCGQSEQSTASRQQAGRLAGWLATARQTSNVSPPKAAAQRPTHPLTHSHSVKQSLSSTSAVGIATSTKGFKRHSLRIVMGYVAPIHLQLPQCPTLGMSAEEPASVGYCSGR